jgi:hypothetical protein
MSNLALLAQRVNEPFYNGWGIGQMAIALIIICGVIAIVLIFCKSQGVTIPSWLIQVLWVVIGVLRCHQVYLAVLSEKENAPMPLIESASEPAVGENIKREMEAGRPRKQAIAIALNTQRRYGGHTEVGVKRHPAHQVGVKK